MLALYEYNEMFQQCLYQFKGCFDIELSTIFLENYLDYINIKFKGYILVPAPSYISHDEARGFNHVITIFKDLKMPIFSCFYKEKDMKQSDLSFNERSNIKDVIKIKNAQFLEGKKVLLIDDVFTSGSTVKTMINLLKPIKPKKISVLVLSKTNQPKHKNYCKF